MNAYVSLPLMFSNSSFHDYKCYRFIANMHTFQKSWVRTEDEQLIEDLEKFYSISIKAAAMVPRRRGRRRFSCHPLAPPGAACELCGAAEVNQKTVRFYRCDVSVHLISSFDGVMSFMTSFPKKGSESTI